MSVAVAYTTVVCGDGTGETGNHQTFFGLGSGIVCLRGAVHRGSWFPTTGSFAAKAPRSEPYLAEFECVRPNLFLRLAHISVAYPGRNSRGSRPAKVGCARTRDLVAGRPRAKIECAFREPRRSRNPRKTAHRAASIPAPATATGSPSLRAANWAPSIRRPANRWRGCRLAGPADYEGVVARAGEAFLEWRMVPAPQARRDRARDRRRAARAQGRPGRAGHARDGQDPAPRARAKCRR